MLPIKDKLIQFYQFVLGNERNLIGSTCQNKNLLSFNADTDLIVIENLELELAEFI